MRCIKHVPNAEGADEENCSIENVKFPCLSHGTEEKSNEFTDDCWFKLFFTVGDCKMQR